MVRLSALLVAICMVVIAGSFGFVLYLSFGVTGVESTVVAVAALTGLAIYNATATRMRYQSDLSGQIGDLSRGTADLARQVGEQSRRLTALEKNSDLTIQKALAATQPLHAEIGELGGMLKQLAQNMAAQDAALRAMAANGGSAALVPDYLPVKSPETSPEDFSMPAVASEKPVMEMPARSASLNLTDTITEGPFRGMTGAAVVLAIRDAVNENRIEVHLQPIVTLPQRKVRYYEALVRLRFADKVIAAADFLPYAEAGFVVAGLDYLMLARCVRVLRRLQVKTRDIGLFCNLSPVTLLDRDVMAQIVDFAEANRVLAPVLVFELPYPAVRMMGARENENLARLTDLGFRLSVDHVADLRFDARELADRKCAYMKIPASVLLGPTAQATADIHPADISGLLSRNGIELIAEKIESEVTVVNLLDFDLKFGQGNLFSPPRPVKQEAPDAAAEAVPPSPAVSAPAVSAPAIPVMAPQPLAVRLPPVEANPPKTPTAVAPPPKNLPAAEFTLSALQKKIDLEQQELKVEAQSEAPATPSSPPESAPAVAPARPLAAERTKMTERGTTIDRNSALARLAKIVARP